MPAHEEAHLSNVGLFMCRCGDIFSQQERLDAHLTLEQED